MENRKYKVLVLLDLKENFDDTLNYTTKLSKLIDADFEFFSVKKPTEIIDTDSQLSAMRSINRDCIEIDKQMKEAINPILNHLNANVKTSFALGNIKTEIKQHLIKVRPHIVVLGKRKQKAFKLIGNNITSLVSQKHDGTVLIATTNGLPLNITSIKQNINHQKREEELVSDK